LEDGTVSAQRTTLGRNEVASSFSLRPSSTSLGGLRCDKDCTCEERQDRLAALRSGFGSCRGRAIPSFVRDARSEDAEAIARIHVRTWQEAYKHVLPADRLAELSEDERATQWRDWLKRSEITALVAVEGDKVRAFASGGPSRDEEGVGELYAIYVEPVGWGTGLGRDLIVETERCLRGSGFREAMLWVLEDNPRARRFYEAGAWFPEASRAQTLLGVDISEIRYRKRPL
jgi:GNAT superfamily N-acetyltransferase